MIDYLAVMDDLETRRSGLEQAIHGLRVAFGAPSGGAEPVKEIASAGDEISTEEKTQAAPALEEGGKGADRKAVRKKQPKRAPKKAPTGAAKKNPGPGGAGYPDEVKEYAISCRRADPSRSAASIRRAVIALFDVSPTNWTIGLWLKSMDGTGAEERDSEEKPGARAGQAISAFTTASRASLELAKVRLDDPDAYMTEKDGTYFIFPGNA